MAMPESRCFRVDSVSSHSTKSGEQMYNVTFVSADCVAGAFTLVTKSSQFKTDDIYDLTWHPALQPPIA